MDMSEEDFDSLRKSQHEEIKVLHDGISGPGLDETIANMIKPYNYHDDDDNNVRLQANLPSLPDNSTVSRNGNCSAIFMFLYRKAR